MADGRLFFALRPPPAVAEALDALAARVAPRYGGRPTHADTLHLTLAFLGPLSVAQYETACAVAQTLRLPPFVWQLDCLRVWSHNGVVWAGAARPSAPLMALAQTLQSGLRAAGFVLDARPFQAHVTLLRRATRPEPDMTLTPCSWAVDDFVLLASLPEAGRVRHRVCERWALRV